MRLRRPPTPREARPSTPTIGDVKTQTALEQGESSSLYEFSHPTHDKATPLSIAVEILKAINQAADIFPPLKTVTGAALYIAQTAEVRRYSSRVSFLMVFSRVVVSHQQGGLDPPVLPYQNIHSYDHEIYAGRLQYTVRRLQGSFDCTERVRCLIACQEISECLIPRSAAP